jgi:hypothetical protein
MEAVSTSETSVNFYETTRSNNPEDSHYVTRLMYLSAVGCEDRWFMELVQLPASELMMINIRILK